MMSVEMLKAIEKLIPGADDAAYQRKRLVRLLADAGGRLRLPALSEALGGGQTNVFASVRGWDGLRWSGMGHTGEVWLAPWVRARLGLVSQSSHCPPLARLDGQDEDEPTAYHQPVPAPTWNIEDEWELANVLWGRIDLGRERVFHRPRTGRPAP